MDKYNIKARHEVAPNIEEMITMVEQSVININFIIDKKLKENYVRIQSLEDEEKIMELMGLNNGLLELKKDFEKNAKEPLRAVCIAILSRYTLSTQWNGGK